MNMTGNMENKYTPLSIVNTLGKPPSHIVEILLDYHKNGFKISADFNGTILYSDKVTMDSAYQEVTGRTKEAFDREIEQDNKSYQQELEEHTQRLPQLTEEWIEKGHRVLDDKYHRKWEEAVPIRLNDLYRGMELGCCLDVVKILNQGGHLEEAKDKLDNQGHSGMSYSLVRVMVSVFCDRGVEFSNFLKIIS